MQRDTNRAFYHIKFENGVSTKLELISKNDKTLYSNLKKEQHSLLNQINELPKRKKRILNKLNKQLEKINQKISNDFPYDFFVIGSDLYNAIGTGTIFINSQNRRVEIKKISKNEMINN